MASISYLDFDLLVERTATGYRARVLRSPAGEAAGEFVLPFSGLELEDMLLSLGRPAHQVLGSASPVLPLAKAFGGELFNAVFAGRVHVCFQSSLDEADRRGTGLRIRLRLTDVPELADLPWEYLYEPDLNRFFSLSLETPIVRYLDLPLQIVPLAIQPPLRILVMLASPSDWDPVSVDEEWTRLQAALADLIRNGMVTLARLPNATLSALQEELRRNDCHVFHFIGHGGFDERNQDGVLILEDPAGQGQPTSAQHLGVLLRDEPALRLVVLNTCEGARTSRTDPFAGMAQCLLQQGIPAVVAMQFPISDNAAATFSREFYAAVADGYPVDAAVTEARKTICVHGDNLEWGTPVLFMRVADGRIFALERSAGRNKAVDPSNLATTVVDLLAPYLAKRLDVTAGVAGESAQEKLKTLLSVIRNRVKGDSYAEQTLGRLEEQPVSDLRRAALAGVLEETIRSDPAFVRTMQKLLEEDRAADAETITQQVTVSGQARTGDIVQIGKMNGSVDLRKRIRRR